MRWQVYKLSLWHAGLRKRLIKPSLLGWQCNFAIRASAYAQLPIQTRFSSKALEGSDEEPLTPPPSTLISSQPFCLSPVIHCTLLQQRMNRDPYPFIWVSTWADGEVGSWHNFFLILLKSAARWKGGKMTQLVLHPSQECSPPFQLWSFSPDSGFKPTHLLLVSFYTLCIRKDHF